MMTFLAARPQSSASPSTARISTYGGICRSQAIHSHVRLYIFMHNCATHFLRHPVSGPVEKSAPRYRSFIAKRNYDSSTPCLGVHPCSFSSDCSGSVTSWEILPGAAGLPHSATLQARIRVADPRDAAALAALDAACASDGSSGWSEGIYKADLQPGGPNLVLLCELVLSASGGQPDGDLLTPTQPQPQPTELVMDSETKAWETLPVPRPIESLLPAAMASEPKAEEVEPAIIVTPQETVRQAAAIGNYSRPRPPAAEDLAAAAAAPRHLDPAEAGAEELSELAAAAAFQQPRAAEADRFSRVDVVGPVVALAAGCEVVGEVSLTNLAVVASMRGTGLGRRILVELLTRLGGERCPVFLEVRKDNTVAQALYDKLGFTTVGLRKRYNPDGSDSLVMTRQPGRLPAVASKPP
ncbi:hypothetical protein Vafri_5158 [Volvox africanus]|uniref:N-acetyltransferase domain-containing protein n=1 Tax=Volvox africanus TaxID=51714 RepID=A0A8J4AVG2_9CHLO|nr:hypothetical protein Vafri_5158 [Volvox africanus]